jgi:hypothetical protein
MTFHLAITFGSQAVGSLNKISGLRAENAVVVRQISSVVSCIKIEELKKRMIKFIENEYKCYLIKLKQEIIGYCLFRDDTDSIYVRQL